MKQAFDMFDKNNDGKISCDELGCVLRTLGHEYSQMEIEDMIKHADINGESSRPCRTPREYAMVLLRSHAP